MPALPRPRRAAIAAAEGKPPIWSIWLKVFQSSCAFSEDGAAIAPELRQS
jgi:hypothetical protein